RYTVDIFDVGDDTHRPGDILERVPPIPVSVLDEEEGDGPDQGRPVRRRAEPPLDHDAKRGHAARGPRARQDRPRSACNKYLPGHKSVNMGALLADSADLERSRPGEHGPRSGFAGSTLRVAAT
ncbi:hypothetical protein THAOC_15520, partial [Thalassiosira oceanica]